MNANTRLGDCSDELCLRCGAGARCGAALEGDVVENDNADVLASAFLRAGVRHYHCCVCGGLVALQARAPKRPRR